MTHNDAVIAFRRYPWGIGYYDMTGDSGHCVDPKFTMLATLLQQQGYSTHAVGKWDVGYVSVSVSVSDSIDDSFTSVYVNSSLRDHRRSKIYN